MIKSKEHVFSDYIGSGNAPLFMAANGLTKRELFAAMAMGGLVSGITQFKFKDDHSQIIVNRPRDVAEISCTYADALIAALEEKIGG